MKHLLVLTCSFLLTIQLYGQDLGIGVKGGLNLSTVTGDASETINPRLAYHFGGFVNIPLSERFSLHPEMLYFSIGNTFDFSFDGFPQPTIENGSLKSVTRANFLAVPVNFRFNFTDSFGLDFGPQVGFLINSVNKPKQGNNIGDVPERASRPGSFRPDYGANIGLTFRPSEKIVLQLRYYQGLKNLIDSSFFPDDRSFNVALQLSAGYVIF